MNLLGKLLMVPGNQDNASKFKEAFHAFLAQRCSNKFGKYVAIAEYSEGCWRGVVMVPEGKLGSGWKVLARIF